MHSNSELRECPFCRGKGVEKNEENDGGKFSDFSVFHFVECDRCGTRGPRFNEQGQAWTAKSFARNNWNLRVTVLREVRK